MPELTPARSASAGTKPARPRGRSDSAPPDLERLRRLARAAARREARRFARAAGTRARGAALLTASGRIFAAPEMPDPGDGTGGCAERTAILRAVLARERRAIELHLAGDAGGRKDAGPPCGRCLQILFEFSPGLRVYWGTPARPEGGCTVRELLPGAFGPRSLAAGASRRRGGRRVP